MDTKTAEPVTLEHVLATFYKGLVDAERQVDQLRMFRDTTRTTTRKYRALAELIALTDADLLALFKSIDQVSKAIRDEGES